MPNNDASRKWWVVAAMAMPLFLLAADNFGVAVVLPQMSRDLDASVTVSNWFYNAFLLSFAAIQLPVGRLGDIVGRRKVMLTGVVTFAGASALCGLAPNAALEIAARALEGAGAAMIYATTLSIVSNAFPPDERGSGIGVWSAIGLVGGAVGPFVGGLLTQTIGWRYFFFVNVPIAVVAVVLTLAKVPESRDETASRKVDWAGFGVVTIALVLFCYGINAAAQLSWASVTVLGPVLAGLVAFAGFAAVERRARSPLVDFSLFRTRNYLSASLVAFMGNWLFAVSMVFLAQYLQSEAVLDMSPMGSGTTFLAFSVPIVVASIVTGRIIAALGGMRRPMAIGSACLAVAFAILPFVNAANAMTLILISLLLAGIGEGFAYNVSTTAAMNEIPDEKAGVASGMIAVIRLMGMIVGVAFTSSLLKAFETDSLHAQFDAAGASLSGADQTEVQGLLSGSQDAVDRLSQLSSADTETVNTIVRNAFTYGLHRAMAATVVVALVAVAGALVYRERAAPAAADA